MAPLTSSTWQARRESVFADGGNLAGLDGDVEHVVDAITLVENAAAFQDEIVA